MTISEDDIRDYLSKMARSNFMGRSARRLSLLEYLVRSEVNGEGESLKAYSIGLDVFDKPSDFDPSGDSSVRVEIGRLRTAIALFEASERADTNLEIEIPIGTYRPVIKSRVQDVDKSQNVKQPVAAILDDKAEPKLGSRFSFKRAGVVALVSAVALAGIIFSVLDLRPNQAAGDETYPILLSVEDFTGDDLGKEIAAIVKSNFANNSVVKILDHNSSSDNGDNFVVRGRIVEREGYSRVGVELANLETNQIVWNHSFPIKDSANVRTEVEREMNGELYTRLFGAAKRLLEQRDPLELTPQQLFILATWVSGPAQNSLDWETERVDLMKIALKKDPNFGPAHSVLADKYGFLANVHEKWDTVENLELSNFHASRAAELLPLDANVMFNVAQSYWHAGRHAESQRTFQRVTELDRGNSLARFFSFVVPYWCSDVPDDIMEKTLAFDASLSPDDPIRWIVLTWIATLHANRSEHVLGLKAATEAAQIFQVGYTFMARAMLLNKLGQSDAAAAIIRRQKKNWPGIDGEHYSTSTIPRLCKEQPKAEIFVTDYIDLAKAVAGKIE